jgi:hypothetical protein
MLMLAKTLESQDPRDEGYYQFLNLVDFMQKNPGAVLFGLNLINRR